MLGAGTGGEGASPQAEEDLLSARKKTRSVCVHEGGCMGGRKHVTHILCQEVTSSLSWSNKILSFFSSVVQRHSSPSCLCKIIRRQQAESEF